MALKKEWKKSTSKATAAAQADESSALTGAQKTPANKRAAVTSESKIAKSVASKPGPESKASTSGISPEANLPKTKRTSEAKAAPGKAAKKRSRAVKELPVGRKRSLQGEDSKGTARVLDSQVAFEGPLFRVLRDHLIEPSGRESHRDVIRHNGSVVILAVDHGTEKVKKKEKKNPWIVIERQYRHAAGQYLWELPAGKLEVGEDALDGAKRELGEETGYAAEKWSPLIEYYASPGFLGEAMKVFLAESLVAGDAHPEDDEIIDFRLVRLSEILKMIDKGKIIDGKTLTTILLYARQLGVKRKK